MQSLSGSAQTVVNCRLRGALRRSIRLSSAEPQEKTSHRAKGSDPAPDGERVYRRGSTRRTDSAKYITRFECLYDGEFVLLGRLPPRQSPLTPFSILKHAVVRSEH